MSGRKSRQWWGAKAARQMAWQGKRVVIARAGQPWMRVELVKGCICWSKLTPPKPNVRMVSIDELWGANEHGNTY